VLALSPVGVALVGYPGSANAGIPVELGLDHYEGRSYLGFHHHCALVTCAHAFLTLERLDPKARRPAWRGATDEWRPRCRRSTSG
jgi:SRSO17 transposase